MKTPFTSIFNPNNANIFPSIKTALNNLKQPNTMTDVFHDFNLVNSWAQPHNSQRIFCNSKFTLEPGVFNVKKNVVPDVAEHALPAKIFEFKERRVSI